MRDRDTIEGEAMAIAEREGRPVFIFSTKRGPRFDRARPSVIAYTEATPWGELVERKPGEGLTPATAAPLPATAAPLPAAPAMPREVRQALAAPEAEPVASATAAPPVIAAAIAKPSAPAVLFGDARGLILRPLPLFKAAPKAARPFAAPKAATIPAATAAAPDFRAFLAAFRAKPAPEADFPEEWRAF
jgi:hypothetical protein